jgi:hypothetical protein
MLADRCPAGLAQRGAMVDLSFRRHGDAVGNLEDLVAVFRD